MIDRLWVTVPALVLGALFPGAASGQDGPPPLEQWRTPPAPPPVSQEPEELNVVPPAGLERTTVELTVRGDWERLAGLLQSRLGDAEQRGLWVRPPGPVRVLLGAREDLRRRLTRLPAPARKAYRARHDPEAAKLWTSRTDADLLKILTDYPASSFAAQSARLLGERFLERGASEDALALWRASLELAPDPALEKRVLAVRARPTHTPARAGALGVAGDEGEPVRVTWARAARRVGAVAADAQRVYFTDGRGLAAVDRTDGRLRWRVRAELAGGQREALVVAHGVVLHLTPRRVSAYSPERGALRWEQALSRLGGVEDIEEADREPLAAVATPNGFVLLASWSRERKLIGVEPGGDLAWRTGLWRARREWSVSRPIEAGVLIRNNDPCRNDEDEARECPGRRAGVRVHPERETWGVHPVTRVPRWVVGDGRLVALGERVCATVDGLVFAAGSTAGELIWLRERYTGLAVGGDGAILVGLDVCAYALTAVTATGLLVRLDPRSGRQLSDPRPVAGEGPPYVLGFDPLVIGWDGGRILARGAVGRPLTTLQAAPIGRGHRLGRALALPTRDGLSVFDGPGGAPVATLDWLLGPAQVRSVPGALLLISEAGVTAVELGGHQLPHDPPPAPDALGAALAALDHPDFRQRLAARRTLSRALAANPRYTGDALREHLAGTPSAEVAEACAELLEVNLRRARWQQIAPGAPDALVDAAVARSLDGRSVEALAKRVSGGDECVAALSAELLAGGELGYRLALLRLLLPVDRALQGRLVALIRNDPDPGSSRAAADLLVAYARAGGSSRGLRLALKGKLTPDGPTMRAVIEGGDEALWEAVRPARLQDVPFAAARGWVVRGGGVAADPVALWRTLAPFFEARRKP